ncbi:MAG: hypothetical protein N3G75_09130 [Methanothrix sp.]|nr:hypothetical protein [Methanothrix sp.]MCX8207970.1 hypothetical protein [Methanothrix sp.]
MGSVTSTSAELRIGIDIGKRHDPTAMVVAIAENRNRDETHFVVPFLKRLDLDLPYTDQVAELHDMCSRAIRRFWLINRSARSPKILVDVTGVGDAVLDTLKPRVRNAAEVIPCRFMAGDRLTRDGEEFRVGKSYFVSRLQVLSESKRIHLPQLPEALQLSQEMLDFDIDVDESSGKATYGAIRPGTHDDMVTALGLACLLDIKDDQRLTLHGTTKRSIIVGSEDWFGKASHHHTSL